MSSQETKQALKRIIDEALEGVNSRIESTLNAREFYIYTEAWYISIEQLDKIREQVKITTITAEGNSIMLTAKI